MTQFLVCSSRRELAQIALLNFRCPFHPDTSSGKSSFASRLCTIPGHGVRMHHRKFSSRATLMMDHFTTLGVRQDASMKEIKSAYRSLVKRYHPDVCRGERMESHLKFIHISNAYENVLNCISEQNLHVAVCPEGWKIHCNGEDTFSEQCTEELADWEEWMGWEGAGKLYYDCTCIDYAN